MPTACHGLRPRSARCWVRPASLCCMACQCDQTVLAGWNACLPVKPCKPSEIWRRLASRLTARPCYTVLQPLFCEKHYGSGLYAKAELRQYEPSLVAEISVEAGDIVTAVSRAEQDLAVRWESAMRLQACVRR